MLEQGKVVSPSFWWTRSASRHSNSIEFGAVENDGTIGLNTSTSELELGVRPAMWIGLTNESPQ